MPEDRGNSETQLREKDDGENCYTALSHGVPDQIQTRVMEMLPLTTQAQEVWPSAAQDTNLEISP